MTEPTRPIPLIGDAERDRIALSEVFRPRVEAEPEAPAAPLPPAPTEEPATPKKKVTLDLDTLDDEEPPESKEPFTFRLGGVEYEPVDPEELDWQDLLVGQENPRLMMHIILPEEQRKTFFGQKLAVRKLKRLTVDYARHYGLGAQGEDGGSAGS